MVCGIKKKLKLKVGRSNKKYKNNYDKSLKNKTNKFYENIYNSRHKTYYKHIKQIKI